MNKEIYQKQFGIGRILSESWKYFTENFKLILLITLIIYIPIDIIISALPIKEGLEGIEIEIRIIQILEGLIGIIATMAIAYLIKNKIDGKTLSFAEVLKKSLSRWGSVVLTNILFGIFIIGLSFLLIIPGIIYLIYWIFTNYAVILNEKYGNEALKYSHSIVKGRWWKVFGYSILFGIIMIITGILVSIPFAFLPFNFATDVLNSLFIDIAFSFFTVAYTVFYINFDATKISEAQIEQKQEKK